MIIKFIEYCTFHQAAQKEKSDLLMELIAQKVVLRSVSVMSGGLCVTRCGIILMLG